MFQTLPAPISLPRGGRDSSKWYQSRATMFIQWNISETMVPNVVRVTSMRISEKQYFGERFKRGISRIDPEMAAVVVRMRRYQNSVEYGKYCPRDISFPHFMIYFIVRRCKSCGCYGANHFDKTRQ